MARRISKKSKRRLMTFGVISIFAIGYFCFTLIGYIYNYINLKNEENSLKNELLTLQDEKASLKVEIQKLNDPTYVVRYAKEKFLYSSENEFVIKINDIDEKIVDSQEKNNKLPIIVGSLLLFSIIIFVLRLKFFKVKKI